MDSRLTVALAGVLLLGAVVAGYWGIALSRNPQPSGQPPTATTGTDSEQNSNPADAIRTPVVVTARALKPFVLVTREDLVVESLRTAPPGSFTTVEEVLGRTVWSEVPAGSWLNQATFEAGGQLAKMIRPEERALAVAVDEVIGGGGHVRPGDYVDVLLYLRDGNAGGQQSAQVALPAVRLLSFGDELEPRTDGQAQAAKKDGQEEHRAPRTAVLAVPEAQVTRLMLASQAGTLRLAVRSVDEHLRQRYHAGEVVLAPLDEATRNLFPLAQLAVGAPRVSAAARTVKEARPAGIEVFRGTEVSRQTP